MANQLTAASSPVSMTVGRVRERTLVALVVIAVSLILALAVNRSSLWIDEGYSTWVACHRSFATVIDTLRIGDPSDRQMPLHYFYLWGWIKVFGESEYAFRSANIPFAMLFVIALAWGSRALVRSTWAWAGVALAPFVWFYMNEARGYMMLMAFSAVATAALLAYVSDPEREAKRAPWFALLALFFAWITHILAAFLFPALLIIVVASARDRWAQWWRDWKKPALTVLLPFLMLGVYYIWTLGKSTAYEYGRPGWGHFGLTLYEYSGLAGIGPPRNLMRGDHLLKAFSEYWPVLIPAGIILACASILSFLRGIRREALILTLAWAVAFGCAMTASFIVDMRFLGRHISALVPLMLFAIVAVAREPRYWLPLALVWAFADVRFATLPQYQKDDYRSAAQYLVDRSASERLAWAADPLTGYYYGLALTDRHREPHYEFDYSEAKRTEWPIRAQSDLVANWSESQVKDYLDSVRRDGRSLLLALSKRDLYDMEQGWARTLEKTPAERIAEFQSFEIYRIR